MEDVTLIEADAESGVCCMCFCLEIFALQTLMPVKAGHNQCLFSACR